MSKPWGGKGIPDNWSDRDTLDTIAGLMDNDGYYLGLIAEIVEDFDGRHTMSEQLNLIGQAIVHHRTEAKMTEEIAEKVDAFLKLDSWLPYGKRLLVEDEE